MSFDGFLDAETAIVTVSSLPETKTLKKNDVAEVNLDEDTSNVMDFRVRLDEIVQPFNPLTGKIKIVYIISDAGLCPASTSSGTTSTGGGGTTTTSATSTTTLTLEAIEVSAQNRAGRSIFSKTCTVSNSNLECRSNGDNGEVWENFAIHEDVAYKIRSTLLSDTEFKNNEIFIGTTRKKTCSSAESRVCESDGLTSDSGEFYAKVRSTTSAGTTTTTGTSSGCSGNNAAVSICNYGPAYCTLGTDCNWYPPNKLGTEGGCCPEGKRWNGQECKEFESSGVCTTFNAYQSLPLPYEQVCCQVATVYGFWDPAIIYPS